MILSKMNHLSLLLDISCSNYSGLVHDFLSQNFFQVYNMFRWFMSKAKFSSRKFKKVYPVLENALIPSFRGSWVLVSHS